MRKFLVICMLLLMPLQGLLGDAMAYEMLASHQTSAPSAQLVASQPVKEQTVEQAPCHMETASALHDDLEQSSCTVCQACHSSAIIYSDFSARLTHPERLAPLQQASFWDSADLVQPNKPPVF